MQAQDGISSDSEELLVRRTVLHLLAEPLFCTLPVRLDSFELEERIRPVHLIKEHLQLRTVGSRLQRHSPFVGLQNHLVGFAMPVNAKKNVVRVHPVFSLVARLFLEPRITRGPLDLEEVPGFAFAAGQNDAVFVHEFERNLVVIDPFARVVYIVDDERLLPAFVEVVGLEQDVLNQVGIGPRV